MFGRTGHGEMYQTRSLRIDLTKFKLSSENKRVLRKTENITLNKQTLPYSDYHWSIGKLAKDFYDTKFGPPQRASSSGEAGDSPIFSANKVKELLTEKDKSNFNTLLKYTLGSDTVGYAICLETNDIFHYCYPFYNLTKEIPNQGLGMMLKAIVQAQTENKKYVYLGSFSRPTDTYKLQFEGLEWFDGKDWQTDQAGLKNL